MDFIRFTIDNPVKITVGVILLVLFGWVSLLRTPVQLTPNVDPTIITVNTTWTGISPEEIEREIIEPQEDVLKNVANLITMTSRATEGDAEIELEFVVGTDLQAARVEVSDSLREVAEYPDEAEEPVITDGEAGAGSPIAWLLLEDRNKSFDIQKLGERVEERIKPALERIKGVSEVRVYGGRDREIHINFDPNKVAQRRITLTQLRNALDSENVNVSAGDLKEGRYATRVRTTGQFVDVQQILDTVVTADENGGPIRIRDFATVTQTFEERRSFVRSSGQISIAMPVYREPGANVISVMEEVRQRIVEINETVLPQMALAVQRDLDLEEPPDLAIKQVYDETVYIYDAIGLVQNNLLIGGTLAILALLFFLRGWRPVLVIAFSIPISVIGTFVVMYAAGRNMNVISLAGLAFAVGMVVDNAIVVLENIDRHLLMGKNPMRAAFDATREVWGAILASTLTTLAVFIPILTVQEEAGQLFRDIAIAVCAAVTLSLIVAITVIPTVSARLLRTHKAKDDNNKPRKGLFTAINDGLADWIHAMLAPTAPALFLRILIVAGFMITSIVGAALLMPPTDYLPRGNQNLVFGVIILPPGYDISTSDTIGQIVESKLRAYWEAESQDDLADQPPVMAFDFMSGEVQQVQNIPPIADYFFVTFNGGVFHGAISQDKNNVAPLASLLSSASNSTWGFGFAQQASLFGRGAAGSRTIDIDIAGESLETVRSAASAIQGQVMGRYGPMAIQPDPLNFDKPSREIQFEIDRVKAADLGISVRSLGNAVAALVDGVFVGDYRIAGETIDIRAMGDADVAGQPELIAKLPIAYQTASGEIGVIPVSSIATIKYAQAPQEILRIEEQRAVTLAVTPPDEVPLEIATAELHQVIDSLRQQGMITPDVGIDLTGSAAKLTQVREALIGTWYGWTRDSLRSIGLSRMFLAVLVVFLLMAALFESYFYPLVVMITVPLATLGGFIGLAITHSFVPTQLLDVLTMLGFVILIGVVVNNAILIVHQTLNFMHGEAEDDDEHGHQKLAPREAIRASVHSRIRPIFMTTTTSVSGMLPLVLMPGSGSELYRGLGSVVVGGLIVATLFTLIVVPLLLSLMIDFKRFLGVHDLGKLADTQNPPI
ncbi:efflux RND transporter permease subunit [Mucisphaera calidilacus]|uniref:Efflux pump membrane transporter BepE n=1 Tax=Mucisphaera calidilacus TaxID=2527982 RepID=A0A518BW96_9BACT|nr:efflux RND transporter permease subunit [Mucisphaera calidilacus]QDU71248.1 Efflux pump membrane transporter BepE [Mucisphaera calidilacus]